VFEHSDGIFILKKAGKSMNDRGDQRKSERSIESVNSFGMNDPISGRSSSIWYWWIRDQNTWSGIFLNKAKRAHSVRKKYKKP
jgi:hypothetical protein